MTTPSGTIGLSDVNVELGFPATSVVTMNDAVVRTLAGVGGSGTIVSMNDLRGKTNRTNVFLTLSSDTNNYDVFTAASASPSYLAGKSDIVLTINSGVVVGSASTGSYALLVPSSFNPADTVTIVNNGTIRGQGGNGGAGGSVVNPTVYPSSAGSVGGNAVYVNRPTVITNNGNIWAGGGGGGGGAGLVQSAKFGNTVYGGGGGGGAQGHSTSSGGAGGSASNGLNNYPGSPGGNGSSAGAGVGGAGGAYNSSATPGAAGGNFGASGLSSTSGGGLSGYYIVGNAFVTYPATGSRLGRVA